MILHAPMLDSRVRGNERRESGARANRNASRTRTESRRPCRRDGRLQRPPPDGATRSVRASRNRRPPPRLRRHRRATPVQHGERRVEALQHHLGGVFILAVLVLPFACLQSAFEVNLRALLQVLLGDLAEALVEDHHAVPLGLFLALAGGLVAPAFRGRDPQIGDRPPVLRAPDFGIGRRDCRSGSPC